MPFYMRDEIMARFHQISTCNHFSFPASVMQSVWGSMSPPASLCICTYKLRHPVFSLVASCSSYFAGYSSLGSFICRTDFVSFYFCPFMSMWALMDPRVTQLNQVCYLRVPPCNNCQEKKDFSLFFHLGVGYFLFSLNSREKKRQVLVSHCLSH